MFVERIVVKLEQNLCLVLVDVDVHLDLLGFVMSLLHLLEVVGVTSIDGIQQLIALVREQPLLGVLFDLARDGLGPSGGVHELGLHAVTLDCHDGIGLQVGMEGDRCQLQAQLSLGACVECLTHGQVELGDGVRVVHEREDVRHLTLEGDGRGG